MLDGIPKNLPGLMRSQKLQKKAAKHGFDWDKIDSVFNKLDEEITEFKEAVLSGKNKDIAEELGVSARTVSRVLNRQTGVGDATRARGC